MMAGEASKIAIKPRVTDQNIEYVIRLAEFRYELRQQRLARRWQMMLAIWAFLVGAIVKARDYHPGLLASLAVVAFVGSTWWMVENWHRDRKDVDIMHGWQDAAARYLDRKFDYGKRSRSFRNHPDNVFQVIVTLCLCLTLVLIVWPRLCPIPGDDALKLPPKPAASPLR